MMLSHNCGLSSEAKKEAKEVDPLHAGNTSSDFHNHLSPPHFGNEKYYKPKWLKLNNGFCFRGSLSLLELLILQRFPLSRLADPTQEAISFLVVIFQFLWSMKISKGNHRKSTIRPRRHTTLPSRANTKPTSQCFTKFNQMTGSLRQHERSLPSECLREVHQAGKAHLPELPPRYSPQLPSEYRQL